MPYTEATLQLLSTDGTLLESDRTAEYRALVDGLDDDTLRSTLKRETCNAKAS